jgi:hypothetical protein
MQCLSCGNEADKNNIVVLQQDKKLTDTTKKEKLDLIDFS